MTDIACRQPRCNGTITDGYCNVCGSPAAPPPPPSPRASHKRPGPPRPNSGQLPAGVDAAVSTPSRASNQLASVALGSARTAGGTASTLRRGTSSTRLRAARLGAGLTTVPPRAAIEASTAVMANPEVEEGKRFCPACGSPVGRSRGDQQGRTEGFCPKCRSPFSFAPKLKAGDLVAKQYEVAGVLAHGGLGWIYLARDRNVSDRWVVLKGLLNSGDPDALAAAIAEQEFLAQVSHPSIVEIYNFVTHDASGYIVMEYVGGTSLKALLKERMRAAGCYDPLPLDQAIAFILEILPAFQYLHDLGLVYCDFKPDNIIQVGDDVRLIDLGGVRRLDDMDSAIYGTVGYQAPEVAEVGPSVASDIYTIGRTLVVLAMEFRGYQSTYLSSFPAVEETPLFQGNDSFYRLVLKACAPDPADRFASAAELRVQLLGVLREVVAAGLDGSKGHQVVPSLLFEIPKASKAKLEWQDLPGLIVDNADPQTGWLASLSVDKPEVRLAALAQAPERSPEVLLDLGRTALLAGHPEVVAKVSEEMLTADPWEWRAVWLQGLVALSQGKGNEAQSAFNTVYGQVPGELAPKLALGVACELSNERDVAEALFETCARSDPFYTAPAAFGISRIRGWRGDVDGAVAALDLVPRTSSAYTEARRQRAGLYAASGRGLTALADAMESVKGVSLEPLDRARLTVNVFSAALKEVVAKGERPSIRIGPHPADEHSLRDGLEAAYRELAALAGSREERVPLVDAANTHRRWTLR